MLVYMKWGTSIAVAAGVGLIAIGSAYLIYREPAYIPASAENPIPEQMMEGLQENQPLTVQTTTSHVIVPGRLSNIHDPQVLPGEHAVVVPVLMYHYIRDITPEMTTTSRWLSVTPEHFRAQMAEVVKLGYHTITPDDLADAVSGTRALPTKPLLITFDDGYRDQYDIAFPILKELQLKATFFIITNTLKNPVYQNADMIREEDQSGSITIASHTRNHPLLAHIKPAQQHDEIFGSKKEIENVVHHPVTSFAYPYGNFDEAVKTLVSEAGFRIAFSTLLGSVHTPSSIFEARRIRVLDDESLGPILKRFVK